MKTVILIVMSMLIFTIVSGCIDNSTEVDTNPTKDKTPVSTSFSDFGNIYCGEGATSLQKENLETLFNEKFKNKYVIWTGIVKEVSKESLMVRHCRSSLVLPDVSIVMRSDQESKLIQLRIGEKVTYKARLFQYGSTLGIYADDGEIMTNDETMISTDS